MGLEKGHSSVGLLHAVLWGMAMRHVLCDVVDPRLKTSRADGIHVLNTNSWRKRVGRTKTGKEEKDEETGVGKLGSLQYHHVFLTMPAQTSKSLQLHTS